MPAPHDEDVPETIGELVGLLDLEVLDRDLYRAHNVTRPTVHHRLFGGQVAAQALRAATLTVADDREPHSLHGYYLRPGRSDIPTILHVDRDRDGRSLSARRVTAVQEGEVIFTLSASFAIRAADADSDPTDDAPQGPTDGATGPDGRADRIEYQRPLPASIPGPDDLGPSTVSDAHPAFEIRNVDASTASHGLSDAYWARPFEPLPDDPLVHACVAAYRSDMGVGEGELAERLRTVDEPSVDHALWFHRPARMDDWILFAMEPVSAQAGRLLYRGALYDTDRRLVATMTQECLLRDRTLRARPAAADGG